MGSTPPGQMQVLGAHPPPGNCMGALAPRSGFFQEIGFILRVKTRLPLQSLRSNSGWVCLDFYGFTWISLDFVGFPWLWLDFGGFEWLAPGLAGSWPGRRPLGWLAGGRASRPGPETHFFLPTRTCGNGKTGNSVDYASSFWGVQRPLFRGPLACGGGTAGVTGT